MALPVLVEPVEVVDRLEELGLSQDDLIQVIQAAVGAKAGVTPLHPKSAPGQFAYQEGTYRLRSVLASKGWIPHACSDNIESVLNEHSNIKIVFQNALLAGNPLVDPIPTYRKGAGSARAVARGQQGELFPELLEQLPVEMDATVWYLFVQADGLDVRAELSRPKSIEDERFQGFYERIILVQEGEWDTPDLSDHEQVPDMEIDVTRKAS